LPTRPLLVCCCTDVETIGGSLTVKTINEPAGNAQGPARTSSRVLLPSARVVPVGRPVLIFTPEGRRRPTGTAPCGTGTRDDWRARGPLVGNRPAPSIRS